MFKVAKPIFLRGQSSEKNILAVFRADFHYSGGGANISVAASTFYRLKINGEFAGYGPARAPHGYCRVDATDITGCLKTGNNTVSIEVISYNINSFYTVMHPGFLIAEITAQGACICATGRDFNGFRNEQKVKKVMRYSFQRHLTEIYDTGKNSLAANEIEEVPFALKTLERETPFPDYPVFRVQNIIAEGKISFKTLTSFQKNRFIEKISPALLGFYEKEIEINPFYDYQNLEFVKTSGAKQPFQTIEIKEKKYVIFDLTKNKVGFIISRLNALENSNVLFSFDEYMADDFIDFTRWQTINIINYRLVKGGHSLETIEPYGFRYLKVVVLEGKVEVLDLAVREYSFPAIPVEQLAVHDQKLQDIYEAAVETFRQNTLDVYMDCPTRERAGWLCDSYYTAKSEFSFTGRSVVEKVFLENFVLGGAVPHLPKGMLPMCYPGDFFNGKFIPQWAFWYVLELEEYLARNQEADKAYFKQLCYDLLEFFKPFVNRDGLLEKLGSWNFIEWSKANEWCQDVNYPTNMLYARVLEAIGAIYHDDALTGSADAIRKEIIAQSYNGKFFVDNAVRNERGGLAVTNNISEVCQYYAVCFKTIDLHERKYHDLKTAVFNIFGPDHGKYQALGCEVEPANALMGIYLRMELLLKEKQYTKLLQEIKDYFGEMPGITGTLWEHNKSRGSLNHGFASFVGAAIKEALRGERNA